MGHKQLMFDLGGCAFSQLCAHSEHESVAKSINQMGLGPIFHRILTLKPVELKFQQTQPSWIGIKLQFYNVIFEARM